MKKYLIVVAGGKGVRMGGSVPKQFLSVKGKPVLMRTLEAFYSWDKGMELIVVLPEEQQSCWKHLCAEHGFHVPHKVASGGETRFHSVKNGFSPAVFRESHDASVISSKSVVNNPAIRFIYRVILCNFAIADGGGIFDASAQRCKVSNL